MSVTIGPNLNSPSPPETSRTARSGANNQPQRATADQAVTKALETTAQTSDAVALNPSPAQTEASNGSTIPDSRSASDAASRAKQMMTQNPQMAVMAQANASPAAVLALLQRA